MARVAKRGRHAMQRPGKQPGPAVRRLQGRVVLQRMRQGCYGFCAASAIAIPAALLSDHTPAERLVVAIFGTAVLAGATGLLLELFEIRVFPGGKNGS